MPKFRVYVIPASRTASGNPNERPKTTVMRSTFGAQIGIGLSKDIDEAFEVKSREGDYSTHEALYQDVLRAVSGLGIECTRNLMEHIDQMGKWDITRLIPDREHPIKYPQYI